MFEGYQDAEELIQNLTDAGCSTDTIDRLLSCLMNGDKGKGLVRLEEQRAELLGKIHKEKSCIEYLDELLCDLKR